MDYDLLAGFKKRKKRSANDYDNNDEDRPIFRAIYQEEYIKQCIVQGKVDNKYLYTFILD